MASRPTEKASDLIRRHLLGAKEIPRPKPLLGFAQKNKGRTEKHFKIG